MNQEFVGGKDERIGIIVLYGSCVGCRAFTWLCRQDRKCRRYSKKIKGDYAKRVIEKAEKIKV